MLVIALHGVGGTGPRMESYSGFSEVADRHGFLVAYPNSAGAYWNSTAARGLPNDVRFLSRLVGAIRCRGRATVSHLAVRTTTFHWSRCTGGVQVEHIRILHGRHQWPGATPADPGPPSTFCAACEIWRFFAGLRGGSRRW